MIRTNDVQPALDPTKLLGFRNLAPVTGSQQHSRESAELVFNKKGIEGIA